MGDFFVHPINVPPIKKTIIYCNKNNLKSYTSSGSTNLNSKPLPVQIIIAPLIPSSNNANKNCHN